MKPVSLAVILSCCLAYAYCQYQQCRSSEVSIVQQQWASAFGSDEEGLQEFGDLCYDRSATFELLCLRQSP